MSNFLKTLGASIIVALTPIKAMLITTLILVGFDLILGVMAAKKSKKHITSSGFRRSVRKLLVYELAIILSYLAQHFMTNDAMPFANIVAGFIGLTELTSCLENLNKISGRNILSAVIDKLDTTKEEK